METGHTKEIDLGLERVNQVRDQLKLDFSQQTVITVAGTNGKGSCVRVLQQLLCSAEASVVCFTSPHFLRYNERISYNNELITDQQLIEIFHTIDIARGAISLSYFEFSALAAMVYAQQTKADYLVLEVGLGGRLDAVNCIDTHIAIVTSIGIDHEAWLGNDRHVIAKEKCGIFRKTAPAISGDLNPPSSIAETAQTVGCDLIQHGEDFTLKQQANGLYTFTGLGLQGHAIELQHLDLPTLPLPSIACALQAIALSSLDLNALALEALPNTTLQGRWQQLNYNGNNYILDVAHNPDAAALLAKNLQKNSTQGKTYGVFAVMADKDIHGIVSPLITNIDEWLLPALNDNERAAAPEKLKEIITTVEPSSIATMYKTVEDVIESLQTQLTPQDRVIIFGSFFTVSEFLAQV